MIEEPAQLTIRRPSRRPSAAKISAFRDVPSSFVVDAQSGRGALDWRIGPIAPDELPAHVAGPALTAGNGPADIMATLAALAFLRPGDVLVAAASGHQGCAAAGDSVSGMAKNAGAVGIVTDGPMRDYQGVVSVGLPCWCTGLTPASPFSTGPGTVGLPVLIGGLQVETGDMIVADRDGVVVVPYNDIDDVIARIDAVRAAETVRDREIAEGLTAPDQVQAWLQADAVRYVD